MRNSPFWAILWAIPSLQSSIFFGILDLVFTENSREMFSFFPFWRQRCSSENIAFAKNLFCLVEKRISPTDYDAHLWRIDIVGFLKQS